MPHEAEPGPVTNAVLATAAGGPEVLRYLELPRPEPGPGRLRLRTACTSVNFADIKARQGDGAQDFPFVPGLDCAGTVDALGPGVTGFVPGQRVAAYTEGGSYADVALADARLCYPLPENVSFEQGAGIGVLITAWNVLTLAGRLEPGETVLVHAGAGGVGSTLIRLARELGAGRVLATVGSDAKAEVVLGLGADAAIVYTREPFAEAVLERTGGRGVDLVCDSIAGAVAEQGMDCLAPFGRLVIFGHTGQGPARIASTLLHRSNRAVIGYSSGGHRKARPERLAAAAREGLELLAAGKLELLVGARYPLRDAARAQELVEGRGSVGKVLLLP